MSTINQVIMNQDNDSDKDNATDKETIDFESIDESESNDQNDTVMEEIVYGYNEASDDWHCMQCGVNMGPNNPRQLCCKYYCPEAYQYTQTH